MSIREKFFIKKFAQLLLNTPLFTKNPIYEYAYYTYCKMQSPKIIKKINTVIIENSNYCNMSCLFCPHDEMTRPKGFMDFDLFKKIVDDCQNESVSNLLLYGFGEPLLDKNYINKVKYAKDKGIQNIECTTNGILLNKKTAESLVDVGLTRILLSIDASTPETYGKIHRTVNTSQSSEFRKVVENIRYLIEYRNKKKKKNPIVFVRFREFDINKKEVDSFRRMFLPIVDHVKFNLNVLSWPDSSIEWPLFNFSKLIKFPCYNLWSSMFITFNGKVGLCCLDYNCQVVIGDMKEQKLREVWGGKTLSKIRRLHLDAKSTSVSICKKCLLNTHVVMPWWFV